MLPRVFEIDEILRVIATHVVDLEGSSAIALACCCKALEEPVLSLCWEGQSLDRLAGILPTDVLYRSCPKKPPYYVRTQPPSRATDGLLITDLQTAIRLPTKEEQRRLLRYASWIERIEGVITRRFEAFFDVLQFCSPTKTPFPRLRAISWRIYPMSLPFLPLFVSPRMTTYSMEVYRDSSFDPTTMERDYLAIAVAALPPFLREFSLHINPPGLWNDALKSEVLYVVQRCGSTLTHLDIDMEFPTATIHHIMRFPNLHTWKVHRNLFPAGLTPSSESLPYLPTLCSLTLTATNVDKWVTFLATLHPPLNAIRLNLAELDLSGHYAVDSQLIARVCSFKNLTRLVVGPPCPNDRCVFSLTDDDLSDLSLALPRLEWLMLGHQCDKNTCKTTFRSLLFVSARCPSLAFISVHFNTVQIAQDIRLLFESGDPRIRELWESPTRCKVVNLSVYQTPLSLFGSHELDLVKRGFLNVFPQLRGISRKHGRTWQCLTEALGK